ncbi:hypothetical protein OHB00_31750 [Streptomyces sp. NBC_00631]|uniref:hypothetical protein n=1 Tax=Streptomyces sp. NBC_00631 TaxID=2975793 RepID=UPI0030E0A1AE
MRPRSNWASATGSPHWPRRGTGARHRRDYGITDAGRAELRRWLTEPGLDLAFRSAALLRVFFLWTLTREEGVDYLEKFAQTNRERLAALESIRDNAEWVGDPVQVCGWLILEYGLRRLQDLGGMGGLGRRAAHRTSVSTALRRWPASA